MEKEEFGLKLGARIRELREKNAMSVRDFETYENSIDRHALSRIETGETIPSAFTLYRIAQVLGVPVGEFFKDLE